MNPYLCTLLGLTSLAAGTARAQPPDVVGSWNANTGIGSGVFHSIGQDSETNAESAAGYHALYALPDLLQRYDDVAFGVDAQAGYVGIDGMDSMNTGFGAHVLQGAVLGANLGQFGYNTALGSGALTSVTNAIENSAAGFQAMYSASTGSYNTAIGSTALYRLDAGALNTALGYDAMNATTNGSENAATGAYALQANTTGGYNSGFGYMSLNKNTIGGYNTALGAKALRSNGLGSSNLAVGYAAEYNNTSGNSNVGIGYQALFSVTTGSNNVALGGNAGYQVTASNNVDIGNQGLATDSGVIRIGTPGTHVAAFMAGVNSTKLTGAAVYVNSNGQLGVLPSARRYKTDIAPMNERTAKLASLRPVAFHLKGQPGGVIQYGLIAEEVVGVYPELVTRDTTGRPDGVRYDELAPMLLNEFQKLQGEQDDLRTATATLAAKTADLRAAIAARALSSTRVAQR